MGLRARSDDDIPALTRILDEVAADGYPPHRPAEIKDFVAAGNEVSSLVYEVDGDVVGHIAVHEYSARSVMAIASQGLDTPIEQLAAVARLFVAPHRRRQGVARTLLEGGVRVAHDAGRHPILDVWEGLPAAIALYESAGWVRLGMVTIEFRSGCSRACLHEGTSIRSFVYTAPPGGRRGV